jgi:hypothetical protein
MNSKKPEAAAEVVWGIADQSTEIPKSPVIFSPVDPYPLLSVESHTYPQAQAHATQVDTWLGFQIREVEHKLQLKAQNDFEKRERWVGLDPAALLTPYTESRRLLQLLAPKPGQKIVDLGAGYARMGFVLGEHYPEVKFVGYEISEERVREGNRVLATKKYPHVQLLAQDLSKMNFVIGGSAESEADYYFLYDFGTLNSIKKALLDLHDMAMKRAITVIGRGRACRDQIERKEPWLSQIVKPEHHGNFSIYRSGA